MRINMDNLENHLYGNIIDWKKMKKIFWKKQWVFIPLTKNVHTKLISFIPNFIKDEGDGEGYYMYSVHNFL